MARRKTLPESLHAKMELAERLAALRLELFGERGGPEMARRLGIPVRTWYNYEGGVTVPAEVVLKIIELTSIDPGWLLHGKGPKFRRPAAADSPGAGAQPTDAVGALLRAALRLLDGEASPELGGVAARLLETERARTRRSGTPESSRDPRRDLGRDDRVDDPRHRRAWARREWLQAQAEGRCAQVVDDAMAPLAARGSIVAYAREAEPAADLDGRMVVAWTDAQPLIRWFRHEGNRGLLEAENPAAGSPRVAVALDDPARPVKVRRVLWIESADHDAKT